MSRRTYITLLLATAVMMIGIVLILSALAQFSATEWAAPITIFVLTGALGMIWLAAEQLSGGYSYKHCLNPRHASWAFLADPFVAVAAAIFSILRPPLDWGPAWLSVGAALAAAFLGAAGIRALDYERYVRYRALKSYNSFSKLAHDFFSLPVLLGSVVGLGLPVVLYGSRGTWFWVAIGCLGIWVLGALKDLLREPNPLLQHTNQSRW